MADSYRAKPRKIMAKRRREENPDFKTRVIERRPNHGDGYPLNKKLISKIIDIIPDEYLFGLKTIELQARGERIPGKPLGTYNTRTQHIIIYSYPVDKKLYYADFEDTEKWKEVFQIWADLPEAKDFGKDHHMLEYISDCAVFCKVLFHEIGHHYTYNYKTRKKPARKEEHIELQAELFGPRIMKEVLNGIRQIIPSPFASEDETTIASRITVKQRFSSAIRRGTGEAHLLLKENPDKDFSKIILHAVLNNLSWLGFSDREEYHYEIINLSAQKDKLKQSIINKLEKSKDQYLSDRLVMIVTFFAREGDMNALATLYDAFQKRLKNEVRFWGYEEDIVAIDGLKGLITIAEMAGEVIVNDPEADKNCASYEANTEIIDFLQAENPEINVTKELEKLSEVNSHIRAFLTTYKNHLNNKGEEKSINPKKKKTESTLDYKTLKRKIKDKKMFSIPSDESKRKIPEADIIKLAGEFIKEKDIELQEGYLRVFSRIKFPYDYKYILKIAANTDSENAIKALSHFKSKEIRDFALKQIAKAANPAMFVCLLIKNYKVGDSQLLINLLENTNSESQLETIMNGIKAIFRNNKTAECFKPLMVAYDKHNCDMCREEIISIMIENRVLSDRIKSEMPYDSNEEIRKMVLHKQV